ncbi:hypothetical protein [Bacillus alveayuensis]|uniref:Uncharacterized protein n=1 Tax=Aeribacillus alveayuensis TaxID=279215 RepID=A0ABT9VMB8_9BACI|nr:hypothetical protein [Bacillus alveayuensis]MDQ0162113.1 hypothetical protein [Bacillus alveayuensis]
MEGKWAVVLFFHSILWSAFTVIVSFSGKDILFAKMMIWVIFFFIAYQISSCILHVRKYAFLFTSVFMIIFFMGQQLYMLLFA